jgi:hypothetical protein
MRPANRNPLIPASLAADGMKGADARANGHCGAQHTPHESAPLFLARVAIDAARVQLNAYALATDDPLPGTVEAADLLDAARAALNGAS